MRWSRVIVTAGCWGWLGNHDGRGYARTKIGSRTDGTRRTVRVHQLMFAILHGPVPEGMEINHRCENKSCVNPWHLEPLTHRDNVLYGENLVAVRYRRRRAQVAEGLLS